MMDLLRAEIARKKQQIEKTNVLQGGKKYFSKGDLSAKLEEEYWRKNKRLKKDNDDDVAAAAGPSTSKDDNKKKEDEATILPRKEVIRRLRERDEPITLFNETEMEAYKRLRQLEILQPDPEKGFRNELKAAMDDVEQQYLKELVKSSTDGQETSKACDVKVKNDVITDEDMENMKKELTDGEIADATPHILRFLKYILQVWGQELNAREVEVKMSGRGKLSSAHHNQTVQYMKPLFRQLKHRKLPEELLDSLRLIVKYLVERDYIMANHAYMEMAIGNAPWPIGVTMVGIHARTGREKIFSKNVAHVLNDETQRKYIQGLKRLMTQCQQSFPTDPSRSVDYDPNKKL